MTFVVCKTLLKSKSKMLLTNQIRNARDMRPLILRMLFYKHTNIVQVTTYNNVNGSVCVRERERERESSSHRRNMPISVMSADKQKNGRLQ